MRVTKYYPEPQSGLASPVGGGVRTSPGSPPLDLKTDPTNTKKKKKNALATGLSETHIKKKGTFIDREIYLRNKLVIKID